MAVATKAFFDMTYDKNTTEAVLFGDACYNVSGPMAEISRQWAMFQLSYGDTDPVLSDRDKYPNFFRIVPSDSDFNPARLALLRHFNWSIVGTIFQDASHGSARYGYAHNRFASLVETSKINITEMESFSDDPTSAIQNLKERDVRIIVGNFNEDMARRVFCSARQKGMYGPRHQWIILGTYSREWWRRHDNRVPCSPQELNETLHGYIATGILPLSTDEEKTESGWTPEEYMQLYEKERGSEYSIYHGYAYDGIWVIARAMERLLDDNDNIDFTQSFTSLEQRLRGDRVGKALNDTNIRGVTGRVQFNNGDRLGRINILQMQGGKLIKVAEYSALTEQLDFSKGNKIIWWRDDRPPKDRTVQYEELRHVSTPVYLSLVVLASTGIIMACCFLGLNIHFRRHRFIKMSSPNMNNVIIVGCILCYFSIVLLGTDGSIASSSPAFFRYWCRARAWVLALGFTLAFGAMFSKTWRVHAIFTNIKLNRKVIKDYKLILVVMVLVMLDVALLVAWQVVDPFQRAEKRLAPEVYEDYEVIPKLESCSSRHMEIWMGSIYAYKGLLLAFGCFLAWETRQVSIPALNDSKYIGMSVYNVVIMCTCGAAVTFLIQDQPTHSFLIIAVFILFATTATLCLVFVPKIIQLRRDPKGDDQRIRATLRKPSHRYSVDNDHFQHKMRLAADENRRLRGFLEQKAAELEQLLEQFGEDPSQHDLGIKTVLHKKVMALRTTDNSPSKMSRASTQSDADLMSTYSDISSVTTSLYVFDSPPGGRPLRARLLNNRLHSEAIELADIRKGKRRKSSLTIPPQAEEEEEDDDPFGGVYLGPPDPPPVKKPNNVNLFPPRNPISPPSVLTEVSSHPHNSFSCNSTSYHEPPTLGLTSSIHHGKEGTQHVSELNTWPEEMVGDNHYSKTPSVLLLQAGQQSRLGVSSGRQPRVNRSTSAPISIWPIAEVGEEDHAPRERMGDSLEENSFPVAAEEQLLYGSLEKKLCQHDNADKEITSDSPILSEKHIENSFHHVVYESFGENDEAATTQHLLPRDEQISKDLQADVPFLSDGADEIVNRGFLATHETCNEKGSLDDVQCEIVEKEHTQAVTHEVDYCLVEKDSNWHALSMEIKGSCTNPATDICLDHTVERDGKIVTRVITNNDNDCYCGRDDSEHANDLFLHTASPYPVHMGEDIATADSSVPTKYLPLNKEVEKVDHAHPLDKLFLEDVTNIDNNFLYKDQKNVDINLFDQHSFTPKYSQLIECSNSSPDNELNTIRDMDSSLYSQENCYTSQAGQIRETFDGVNFDNTTTDILFKPVIDQDLLAAAGNPLASFPTEEQKMLTQYVTPSSFCSQEEPLDMTEQTAQQSSHQSTMTKNLELKRSSSRDDPKEQHSDYIAGSEECEFLAVEYDTFSQFESTFDSMEDPFWKPQSTLSAQNSCEESHDQTKDITPNEQGICCRNKLEQAELHLLEEVPRDLQTNTRSDLPLMSESDNALEHELESSSKTCLSETELESRVYNITVSEDDNLGTIVRIDRLTHSDDVENTSPDGRHGTFSIQGGSSLSEVDKPTVEDPIEAVTIEHCDISSSKHPLPKSESIDSSEVYTRKSGAHGDPLFRDSDGEPDSSPSGTQRKRSGRTGASVGCGIQVYPQHFAETSQQPLPSHVSGEELWACPTTLASSPVPASSRVIFTCDVIEKI